MKTGVLILDNIRSVENTGSIFRTAEGLGIKHIYLIGTTPAPLDRFGRKRSDFAKVSLGAEESVGWESRKNIAEVIEELKSQSFKIISLEQTPESIEISQFDSRGLNDFALIVGNEVDGVSKEAIEMSDMKLEIKMLGKKESLNVSVSAGIAIHELLN